MGFINRAAGNGYGEDGYSSTVIMAVAVKLDIGSLCAVSDRVNLLAAVRASLPPAW